MAARQAVVKARRGRRLAMETQTVYYTCLNDECYKYRGIFVEGDLEHANCARTPIEFEGQSRTPSWMRFGIPAALAIIAGVLVFAGARARRQPREPFIDERTSQTWSGTERMDAERSDYAPPPPMMP
jgi:hypothetical protein